MSPAIQQASWCAPTVASILNYCNEMRLKKFVKSTIYCKTHSNHPSILIMSSSISPLSHLQLSPEIQTFFEQLLNQKLKERDEYYLGQIQAHEEELEARRVMREFGIEAGVSILIDSLHRNQK